MTHSKTPPPGPGRRLFIFGLGFSARALAKAALAKGYAVAGTTRSADKAAALIRDGIAAHAGPATREMFQGATHVLSSVPPDQGDPVLDAHDLSGVRGWIGYLSTTGVYGDHGGAWVDETTPVNPTSARARARVAAERRWLELGAHVFRLAGIYGPGRSALDAVRAGTARRIVKPGQVFSRIHVDDIARVVLASFDRPRPGAVYNVCDDEPAPPQDVIAHACALLGVAPPPEEAFEDAAPTMSAMARSFYADKKRVRANLIRDELGVALAHRDYRSGLRAILAAGG